MKKSWFTLIELIVVITILAILWTIAFMSFKGYTWQTRNAKITSDLTNLHTALSIYKTQNGVVPMPDWALTVTSGGNPITYEWEVWSTVKGIIKADKNMITPLGNNYRYAINGTQKLFSVIWETEEISAIITSVKAESKINVFKWDDVLTLFDSSGNFLWGNVDNTITNLTKAYLWDREISVSANKVTKVPSAIKENKSFKINSCKAILEWDLSTWNGNYTIITNKGSEEVYCDMTTNWGGWTLILAVSSSDSDNFSSFSLPQNTWIWQDSTTLWKFADWKSLDYKGLSYSSVKWEDILIKNSTDSGTSINNVLQSNNCIWKKTFWDLVSGLNWSGIGTDKNWSDTSWAKLCPYTDFGYNDNVFNAPTYNTLWIKWWEVDWAQDRNKDRVMISVGTPTIDITWNIDSPRWIWNFADRPQQDWKTTKDLLSCNADAPSWCPKISENYYLFVR